jgi:prepilin peptidase CpaA
MIPLLAHMLLPLLLVTGGIGDLVTYRIPNWLTAAIALLFFPMAALTGLPFENVLWQCAGAVVLLAVGFGLFAAGLWGGGDAKLLAAAALWFPWPTLGLFIGYTALAGGVLAALIAAWSMVRIDQEVPGHAWITRWTGAKPNVPYGLALGLGGVLAFPETWWMQVH